ncbi:VanZ family protein [Thermodesulfobacteriota bacterium]
MLLGILFYGLRPKSFKFENGVTWLKDGRGVRFNNGGLAFAYPFLKQSDNDAIFENGFSIELSFKPAGNTSGGFGLVLSIHDGRDRNQLVVGQWRSYLIVMNGDDYDHKRKIPRISVDTAFQKDKPIFMTITTGKQGTRIYLDGKIAKSDSKLKLKLPSGENSRLTVGNSVYWNNSWEGEIYGLALYGYSVSDDEAASHFDRKSSEQNFTFAKAYQPALLYTFEEGQGMHVRDHSGNDAHLEIPRKMQVLQKRILSVVVWHNLELYRNLYADVLVNLLGFIPLGLVLSVVLSLYKGQFDKSVMVFSVLICLLLSLGIEFAQAWIPSRSSNLHDLVLNTAGGWIGVVIALKGSRNDKSHSGSI